MFLIWLKCYSGYICYKLMLPNAFFACLSSSLKVPTDGDSYLVRILPESRPFDFIKTMSKFYLQTFLWNFENGQNAKIRFLVTRPFKLFSKKAAQNSWILYTLGKCK